MARRKYEGWFFIILVLFFIFFEHTSFAQKNAELGLPYFDNFTDDDYNARFDNWAVLQGDNGLMYFGNGDGVLEYDGVYWRVIPMPNDAVVRCLAKDASGRIYVGGATDFGYLEPDSTGTLQFVSLKYKLDPEEQDFTDVYRVHVIKDQVYFMSGKWLVRLEGEGFKVWKPSESGFFLTHVINDTLYIEDREKGVQKLVNDEFQDLPEFDQIPAKGLRTIFNYQDQTLATTLEDGFFIKKGNDFSQLETKANDYLIKNQVYYTLQLGNGWLAAGTLKGGLVVLDNNLEIVTVLNKDNGLQNNTVFGMAQDDQGRLWLALLNGITRVEVPSQFTVFDVRHGIEGGIDDLIRYEGDIYVATRFGLLKFDRSERHFIPFGGINTLCLYFLIVDDDLLVANVYGVHKIDRMGNVVKLNDHHAAALCRSKRDTTLIYVGLTDGLAILKKTENDWIDVGRVEGIRDDIREIVETQEGDLWLESQSDGVWHVKFSDEDILHPEVRHFIVDKDLPRGLLFLTEIRREAVFEINDIIYKYNEALDSIVADPDYGKRFGLDFGIAPKREDKYGNVWMYAQINKHDNRKHRTVSLLQPDGSYKLKRINDHRVSEVVQNVLYPEDDGVVWYGGADGIVRHDLNQQRNHNSEFKTMIRRVSVGRDSLIFGGVDNGFNDPVLGFAVNSMRFEFAAPSFTRAKDNRYQFKLEGFDKEWSEWTSETKRDYTNIPEGEYRFLVRAQNIYDEISEAGVFDFEILPPWYRTWWAYMVYIFIASGALFGLVHWRSHQLKKDKASLEKIVDEKTKEIKAQAEKLKELDELKSRFFANISHEFRTPLTLILGPLENKMSKSKDNEERQELGLMHRNAKRLQRLINQLLDLSKIESGNLELNVTKDDIFKFLRATASSFSSLAEQRNISFTLGIPDDGHMGYFDQDKLEIIVYNLLSNAFKFTPDGGRVSFDGKVTAERVVITVTDSGVGINEKDKKKIFDRFYRSGVQDLEGTGIGLALTKELVALNHGSIEVESTEGEGTKFEVELPISKESFKPHEISEVSRDKYVHEILSSDPGPAISDDHHLDDDVILVVEDNSDLRDFIRKGLSNDYKIIEAVDGKDGLDKAEQTIPDLIISDVMMPKMDGIMFSRSLKTNEKTSHIPVILLTAKANVESKIEGLESGVDDYLTKPFNAEELRIRIKNLIEQRQKLRERFSRTVILKPKDIAIASADEVFLEKTMAIIEQHMDDSEFSVDQFQKEIGMSRMQLHRKLKALTNHSTSEFIRVQRLKRAAQLLEKRSKNISEICYEVGFSSLSYFTRSFKEQYGVSPSQYAAVAESKS